jgi:hypothetical protein
LEERLGLAVRGLFGLVAGFGSKRLADLRQGFVLRILSEASELCDPAIASTAKRLIGVLERF